VTQPNYGRSSLVSPSATIEKAAANRVPLLAAQLPSLAQLAPYLERIDRSGWYSNFGPLVQELEARLAAAFHMPGQADTHAITVGNGTAGIELALRALNLPTGSPVLVPALTFVATATAVLSAGLTPIVCDIDPRSWLLTPELASHALARKSFRAVIPVATFGCPQNANGWSHFHARTGVPVIIDAAAGFGNQVDCGPTCSVFSLHATKPLAAGEGGFVVTRDRKFASDVRQLSNFGINLIDPRSAPIGAVTMVGTNAKMSEYHAAVGLASLDAWPENAARRRVLYQGYTQAIREIEDLATQWQDAPVECVRSVCCLLLESGEQRDRVEAALGASGIGTRRWYLPLIDRHPAMDHIAHDPTPVADDIAERLLGIPFHLQLDKATQTTVISALSRVK
jgi:Predicted pyridoxal phosphate-dependent enzyme apparently involved in regulation of cell wall biogenesis